MKRFLAYRVTCRATGKVYIGITTRGLRQRWHCHTWASRNCGGATAIAAAILKHGAHNFVVEEIAYAFDCSSLKQLERALIAQESCVAPNGYNLTTGGDGTHGYRQSDEQRRRHSALMKTKRWTPERAEAMRELFKGRQFTREWRAKISAAKNGKGPSPEQALAHSLKMKGRKKPPRSPEHRAKIAANTRARWASLKAANPSANSL